MTNEQFKKILPALTANYQPSPGALEQIKNVWPLIVIGPSGAGKSTIIDNLQMPFVPSDTTRAIRPDEQDGVDMNFITDLDKAVADLKAGAFVQVAVGPAGDLYATHASSYPASGWAVIPVVADVVPIFRKLGFKKVSSVFIVPPSYNEWMRRMGSHHLDAEALQKRLAEARRSFEFALKDNQTHLVLNDDIQSAVAQIKNYLGGNTDTLRETAARAAAGDCLNQLSASI